MATEKSCTFELCLKKPFRCVELQKIDISADVSSITVYMERGWRKCNLKTGQIFEIKKDAVKILKHMIADISMIAYKNCFYAYLPKCPNFYVYFCWFMTKTKKRGIYRYSAVQRVDSDYWAKDLMWNNRFGSFFEIQRETTESERYWQQLFTMWKQ